MTIVQQYRELQLGNGQTAEKKMSEKSCSADWSILPMIITWYASKYSFTPESNLAGQLTGDYTGQQVNSTLIMNILFKSECELKCFL